MWEVRIVPTDRGLVVSVTDGKVHSVIGRVSWHRWQVTRAMRAVMPFKTALRQVIKRADVECDRLNMPADDLGGGVTLKATPV